MLYRMLLRGDKFKVFNPVITLIPVLHSIHVGFTVSQISHSTPIFTDLEPIEDPGHLLLES